MCPDGHIQKPHVESDPLGPVDILVRVLELGAADKGNLSLIYGVFVFTRIMNI